MGALDKLEWGTLVGFSFAVDLKSKSCQGNFTPGDGLTSGDCYQCAFPQPSFRCYYHGNA